LRRLTPNVHALRWRIALVVGVVGCAAAVSVGLIVARESFEQAEELVAGAAQAQVGCEVDLYQRAGRVFANAADGGAIAVLRLPEHRPGRPLIHN